VSKLNNKEQFGFNKMGVIHHKLEISKQPNMEISELTKISN
jgi:hypothetical protein